MIWFIKICYHIRFYLTFLSYSFLNSMYIIDYFRVTLLNFAFFFINRSLRLKFRYTLSIIGSRLLIAWRFWNLITIDLPIFLREGPRRIQLDSFRLRLFFVLASLTSNDFSSFPIWLNFHKWQFHWILFLLWLFVVLLAGNHLFLNLTDRSDHWFQFSYYRNDEQ